MLKRGQLSIIILTGLVLLIAVSFILYTNQRPVVESPAALEIPQQFRAAHTAITDCLQDKLETAIIVAGVQGSYTDVPDNKNFVSFDAIRIPFWYQGGLTRPTLSDTETQLSTFLNKAAPSCTHASLGPQYTVTASGDANTRIIITDDIVTATIDMPVTLRAGEQSQQLTRFGVTTTLPLGQAFKHATTITNSLSEDKIALDTDLLLSLPANISVQYRDNNDRIIIMREPTKEGSYVFAFAVTLDQDTADKPPQWLEVPTINAAVGQPVRALVIAADPEGSAVSYDVISDKATIDNEGNLIVIPNKAGTYHLTVRAEDANGNAAYTDVEIVAQ